MITNYKGTKVKGSSDIQISVGLAEILDGKRYYNLSFDNIDECHVSVNNGDFIYLKSSQGLFISVCKSLVIQETGITFNWTGVEE